MEMVPLPALGNLRRGGGAPRAVVPVRPPRIRAWCLLLGVIAETVYFAVPVAYQGLSYCQARQPPEFAVRTLDHRRSSLKDLPEFRTIQTILPRLKQKSYRFAGAPSKLDNQAWTFDARVFSATTANTRCLPSGRLWTSSPRVGPMHSRCTGCRRNCWRT